MDKLAQNLKRLENKVDCLNEAVQGIHTQVAWLISEEENAKESSAKSSSSSTLPESVLSSSEEGYAFPSLNDYRDTMVGGSEGKPTESTLERSLAPETQIRRLTAQLTAAYNRIAALEEQLLASRFPS